MLCVRVFLSFPEFVWNAFGTILENFRNICGTCSEDLLDITGEKCRKLGLWSRLLFKRAITWDQHLARPQNGRSWAAKLRLWRGLEWLQHRRAAFASGPNGCTAGRTDTSAIAGHPHTRWQDGIELAKTELPP